MWLEDDPYPRAVVIDATENDELPPLADIAHEINRVEKVLIQLGAEVPDHLPLVDGDERLAAFRLAGMVPISTLIVKRFYCQTIPLIVSAGFLMHLMTLRLFLNSEKRDRNSKVKFKRSADESQRSGFEHHQLTRSSTR